jgi:cytosine/adenosine deaminase-related metal-dependent hydrolase
MTRQLLKHIDVLATMEDLGNDSENELGRTGKTVCGRELLDAAVLIEDNVITAVGPTDTLIEQASTCDEVHELSGHIVIPGLVNTHHHLFQNFTRVLPDAQNHSLFGWLQTLYPIWSHLQPEDFHIAAATGLAELVLSGCTTSSDHQYLFPNGSQLEDSIEAATNIGIRFIATRGSMSIGESKGGLPPDQLCDAEENILKDCLRLIDTHHDSSEYAMTQIALAPCSPFSVSTGLMRDTAMMAADKGVGLHTHLAENTEDIDYSLAQFGQRPGDYAEALGWTGEHVWHAHCVQLNDDEINMFARTKTGVAHCPCSNMRLASGIAPVRKMIDAGVPVGLGVDGSSSSDSGHLLNEARQTMLLQRVMSGAHNLTARQALRLATRGGAEALNRKDIGQIAPGFAADIAIFERNCIELTGTQRDPLAGLIFCGPIKPRHVLVNGRWVVRDKLLLTLSLPDLLVQHDRQAKALFNRI